MTSEAEEEDDEEEDEEEEELEGGRRVDGDAALRLTNSTTLLSPCSSDISSSLSACPVTPADVGALSSCIATLAGHLTHPTAFTTSGGREAGWCSACLVSHTGSPAAMHQRTQEGHWQPPLQPEQPREQRYEGSLQ